jgi:cbb3-type cytochrome oxidase maturation protein
VKYDKCHILRKRVKVTLLTQIRGMSVIYFLISISIVVAVFFLYAFIKAVRSGQYDDDYTPSVRMLFDDELVKKEINKNQINITEEKQL